MILEPETIREIHELAILCEFRTAREALLYPLSEAYRSKMPTSNVPSDQLLSDLNYMNKHAREGSKVPLALWLGSATRRVAKWPERAQRFRQWEEKVMAAAPEPRFGVSGLFSSDRLPIVATAGGLGSSAKESLISAMAACLKLEDLQTAAHRCFGDLLIRAVGRDQPPAVREVALQCIELAEREKMPAVFCHAVLQLDCRDEPLRQQVLALYPELRNADLPFSQIVDAASDLLASLASSIEELTGSGALMTQISLLVSRLKCYKGLHEALHRVKNNSLPTVPQPSSLSADRKYLQDVRLVLTLLEAAQERSNEALMILPIDDEVRASEKPWPTLIGGFAKRISSALSPPEDFGRIEIALARAGGALNRLEDFNDRIVETAMQLLHGPLVTLREKLLADCQSEAVLIEALTAVDSLRLALHVRVLEHTRWQETDSVLFLLDDTLKANPSTGFTKFTRRWGVVRRQLPILTDAERNLDLRKLRALAQQVDGALVELERSLDGDGAGDAPEDLLMLMSRPYDAFRYEAQQQFLRVDAGLKRNCSDLERIA